LYIIFPGFSKAPMLGAKRLAADTFVWEDEIGNKIPFTYVNWNPGEPNGIYGNDDCLMMRNDNGRWNDIRCSAQQYVICEQL